MEYYVEIAEKPTTANWDDGDWCGNSLIFQNKFRTLCFEDMNIEIGTPVL